VEAVYPVVFVDALVAKVRDGSSVRNKAVNTAVGIDCDGVKHVLGIWVAPAEGAKAWAQAFARLRNRGLEDIIICCCDGLSGCCPSLKIQMKAAFKMPMWGCVKAPLPGWRRGLGGGGAGGYVSVTSVMAERAACSSTMALPAA
jgi:hypothetical protein